MTEIFGWKLIFPAFVLVSLFIVPVEMHPEGTGFLLFHIPIVLPGFVRLFRIFEPFRTVIKVGFPVKREFLPVVKKQFVPDLDRNSREEQNMLHAIASHHPHNAILKILTIVIDIPKFIPAYL
jgi:hypothetical protein